MIIGSSNKCPRNGERILSAVSVIRTVDKPQPAFSRFLMSLGDSLEGRGNVRVIGSTRLTLMEGRPIKRMMQRNGYSPQDGMDLSRRLSENLDDHRIIPVNARVNPDRPLRLLGSLGNILAISVMNSEQLDTERSQVEEILDDEFGECKGVKDFDPHISIGEVELAELTDAEFHNPSLLMEGVNPKLPSVVALNGLRVYVGSKDLML